MVPIKTGAQACCIQIDAAQNLFKHSQGHAQQRAHFGADQALHSAEAYAARHVRPQDRDSLVHHLASDGAAYPHRLRPLGRSRMGEQRRKLLVALAVQHDGSALGRHHLKNQLQDLRLQLVEVRNGVNHATDF